MAPVGPHGMPAAWASATLGRTPSPSTTKSVGMVRWSVTTAAAVFPWPVSIASTRSPE